jgi:hypothetical protein
VSFGLLPPVSPVNMVIRSYKESSEALIKKIDKILEQEK